MIACVVDGGAPVAGTSLLALAIGVFGKGRGAAIAEGGGSGVGGGPGEGVGSIVILCAGRSSDCSRATFQREVLLCLL